MKKITVIFIILILALSCSLSSCRYITKKTLVGKGDAIEYVTNLDEKQYKLIIEDIELSNYDNLETILTVIDDDTAPFLRVTTQSNIYNTFKVSIGGDTVKIIGNDKYKYEVTCLAIEINASFYAFEISGGYNVDIESHTTEEFDLTVNGACYGPIKLDTVSDVEVEINGASSLVFTGTTVNADYELNGAGRIDSYGLIAQNVITKLNGAGEIDVYASTKLDATLNGTGKISYDGDPELLKDINGIGTISKK